MVIRVNVEFILIVISFFVVVNVVFIVIVFEVFWIGIGVIFY